MKVDGESRWKSIVSSQPDAQLKESVEVVDVTDLSAINQAFYEKYRETMEG